MTQRTGRADLPLHGGRVPRWLFMRMERLGRVLVEALLLEYGRDELLRRLAHPFWFQSLGCVMGMDWHSSGITTSVLSALKRGLSPVSEELGIWVCGGRGRHSRRTPEELEQVGELAGIDGTELGRTSRLVAKVDSAAVQDGFALYLHGFIVSADGGWCVVQQGMHTQRREARRYHWLSEGLESFVDEPHQAIEGHSRGTVTNLTDRRAAESRARQLELVHGGPDPVIAALRKARPPATDGSLALQTEPRQQQLPHLQMPAHHDVRADDVNTRRLRSTLAAAAECAPTEFPELLLTPGVGARTVEALAFVAEVLHGAPYRFSDPARFSLAHGGKDGHPFPVPLKVYDRTISVMRDAVNAARLGNRDRLSAIRQLDKESRHLERASQAPSLDEHIDKEWQAAPAHGGRTVWDDVPAARKPTRTEPHSYQLATAAPAHRE